MSRPCIGDLAQRSPTFSHLDALSSVLDVLTKGLPAVILLNEIPHLLLPSDAVGHSSFRRLTDLPLLPATILPADTSLADALAASSEEEFLVIRMREDYGIVSRKRILEALIHDLDQLGSAQPTLYAPLPDVVDELPEGILVVDTQNHHIVFANRNGRRMMGLLSKTSLDEPLEQIGDIKLSTLKADAEIGLPRDIQITEPSSRIFLVRTLTPPKAEGNKMLLIIRDVTHVRHRQIRDATQERLALLGRLAGGVAHDFNNLLAVIMMQASLIQFRVDEGRVARSDADVILTAAEKARDLVRQILGFTRRELVHDPKGLDLKAALDELQTLLRRIIGERFHLRVSVADDLWLANAGRAQVERVLTNLVVNARNAMSEGGEILVEAVNVPQCTAWPTSKTALPLDAVRVTVTDTGRGMDEATLSRIFEPFFTSNTESGNGLGLATVLENVEACGGHIHVESTPGKGTTVTLLFSVSPPRKEEAPSRTQAHSAAMTGGQILLVEDREDVRHAIQQILEHDGYVIRACATVEEAKALEATGGVPDLLICDAVLSDQSAATLVRFLRSIAPRLPVLVVSGYPKEEIILDDAFSGIEFLAKPFTGLTLLERVGQLVGEGN